MIPFIFVFGANDFGGPIAEYQNQRFYCPHCHNTTVEARKERKFFTVCWVPFIPISWGMKLHCTTCQWSQSTNEDALKNMANNQSHGQKP